MNSLNQFIANTDADFTRVLLLDILGSPLADALRYLNILIALIALLFICKQIVSRALRAGEDGRIHGSNALAIRLAVIPLFCYPAVENGKLSIGQAAVIQIAIAGSNVADFIYSKMPPIAEAIPLSFSSRGVGNSNTPFQYISSDAASVIGKIYQLRFCQYRLVWLDYDYQIPTPTILTKWDGTQIIQFGAPSQMKLPADACGSISLPPTSDELNSSRFARALNSFSSSNKVPDAILSAHRKAIFEFVDTAGNVIRNADPHRGPINPNLWIPIANQMRADAASYQSSIANAGGAVFSSKSGESSELDQKLGWMRAGFTLPVRSSQIAGRISALTWRPTITVQDAAKVYPLRFAQDTYSGVDRQFNNALQSAGLTVIPKSTAADGMSVESFLGVNEVRAAAELFTNPYSSVFEVSASVGPLLTAAAVSGIAAYGAVSVFLPGLSSFIGDTMTMLAKAGQALTILIPLAPCIGWLFFVISWVVGIVVLFYSIGFYAIAISKDENDQLFLNDKLAEIFAQAVTLFFTPTLLLLGLALSLIPINLGWFFIVSILSPSIRSLASESVLTSAISLIIIAFISVSMISSLVYFSLSKVGGVAKSLAEILSSRVGNLSAGERITGGENMSSPINVPSSINKAGAGGTGTPAGAGGASNEGGRTASIGNPSDKNALHVAAQTRGSRK